MRKGLGKRILAGALALTLVLPLVGCGGVNKSTDLMKGVGKSGDKTTETINSGVENITDTDDVKNYTEKAIIDFGLNILRNSMASDKEAGAAAKNTMISPISILAALAMTANGAKGETLEQMEEVFGMDMGSLNRAMSAYIAGCDDNTEYKLNIANSIWFKNDDSLSVNQDFLQKNADYYEAGIYAAPFDDTTLNDINNWVDENTYGMIKKILGEIPADVIMYLINAVAFDAKWQEPYSENAIHEREFTKEDGTKQIVEFMYSEEGVYLESENATGFMKNYKGNEYAFVAILPDEGITVEEYVASLDGEGLYGLLASAEKTAVNTSIPKFESEYDIELSKVLKSMGMVDAFDGAAADFSGIGTSNEGNIFISRVLHKTYISVDENGTKAAAVTAVELECESVTVEEPKVVYLDRPFVYMIIDTETYKPLFIGTMMDVEE